MGEPADQQGFDDEFQRIVTDALPDVDRGHENPRVPALLVRRASGFTEGFLGRRARFLFSSYDENGAWLAHGFRDGLRIVCNEPVHVHEINEPALWVQEEADYYRDPDRDERIAVGISRLWVEQYVTGTTDESDDGRHNEWLDSLNRDPNLPERRPLRPAEQRASLVGSRVVVREPDGSTRTDMRAVTPVRIADDGELVVAVIEERDWYLWSDRSYPRERHPSLEWVPAGSVWVE